MAEGIKPWAGRANGRKPFFVVATFEVYETDREDSFYVQDTKTGASYAGPMAAVAGWLDRRT